MTPLSKSTVALTAALLLAGCVPGTNDLAEQLLARNALLEAQATSLQQQLTLLGGVAVLLACALAVSLFHAGSIRRKQSWQASTLPHIIITSSPLPLPRHWVDSPDLSQAALPDRRRKGPWRC